MLLNRRRVGRSGGGRAGSSGCRHCARDRLRRRREGRRRLLHHRGRRRLSRVDSLRGGRRLRDRLCCPASRDQECCERPRQQPAPRALQLHTCLPRCRTPAPPCQRETYLLPGRASRRQPVCQVRYQPESGDDDDHRSALVYANSPSMLMAALATVVLRQAVRVWLPHPASTGSPARSSAKLDGSDLTILTKLACRLASDRKFSPAERSEIAGKAARLAVLSRCEPGRWSSFPTWENKPRDFAAAARGNKPKRDRGPLWGVRDDAVTLIECSQPYLGPHDPECHALYSLASLSSEDQATSRPCARYRHTGRAPP